MKNKHTYIWLGALALGVILGLLGITWIDSTLAVVAKIYARLFQLLAIPTIAVAVVATMMQLGADRNSGKIFARTIRYTLATTLFAAAVAVGIYYIVAPGNLSQTFINNGDTSSIAEIDTSRSYTDHLLDVIPDNILSPVLSGNVLGILLLAFAVGIAISKLKPSDSKTTITNFVLGAQDILFILIKWLITILPLGIVAFAEQLTTQVSGGMVADSLGKYTLVIICANLSQMFIVLPVFLLAHRINPFKAFSQMSPAVLTAFFTKSSAATLPLTMSAAETRAGVKPRIARFVLPICTTVNMNGCAAFIAVTSLFVMQNAGMSLSLIQIILWTLIAVVAAIGNAGVPMGCYFLTISLMSDIPGAMAVMGIILPIYTVIDMVETAENVWSDSCVTIMTNKSCPDVEQADK